MPELKSDEVTITLTIRFSDPIIGFDEVLTGTLDALKNYVDDFGLAPDGEDSLTSEIAATLHIPNRSGVEVTKRLFIYQPRDTDHG